MVPLIYSSNFLVSSRPMTILWSSPKYFARSTSVFSILCTLSYMTTVSVLFSESLVSMVCLHFLIGKNPRYKKWWELIPDAEIAVITADGPGRAVTSIPAARTSCISAYPGSEIPGVPASEISAISFHSCRSAMSLSDLVFPEWEWYDIFVASMS